MNKKMRKKLERKKEERLRWIRIKEIMQIVNATKEVKKYEKSQTPIQEWSEILPEKKV